MSPQPAYRACRALHRQVQPRTESIWISDGALVAAFERYCHVAQRLRRMASSAPGPMECRRRLGKRQMTELGSQVHPALPPWAVIYAPDLTKWKWSPPNHLPAPPQANGPTVTRPTKPSVHLPNWIESLLDSKDEAPSTKHEEVEDTRHSRSSPALGILAEIAAARPSADSTDPRGLHWFPDICRHFQQLLTLGALTVEEASQVYNSMRECISGRAVENVDVGEQHHLDLFNAVFTGATSCKVLPPGSYGASFWGAVLSHMSELPASEQVAELFLGILKALPRDCFKWMEPKAVASMLNTLLSAGNDKLSSRTATDDFLRTARERIKRTGRSLYLAKSALRTRGIMEARVFLENAESTYQDSIKFLLLAEAQLPKLERAAIITRTPSKLSGGQQNRQAVTESLFGQSGLSSDVSDQIFHQSLSVLAQMPQVDQAYLFSTLKLYHDQRGGQCVSGGGLCRLLVTQWASRGYGDYSTLMRDFLDISNGSDDKALAALALSIHGSQLPAIHQLGLLHSFWKCLRLLGRGNQIVESLQVLAATRRLSLEFLQHLAKSCHDVQVAVGIQSVYKHMVRRRDPQLPSWGANFWNHKAKRLAAAMDNSLTPEEIYEALDMEHASGKGLVTANDKKQRGYTRRLPTGDLVVRLAVRFASASELTDRQALRRIEQCRRFLAAQKHALPPAITSALFSVLTRSMKENLPGNTTRLRWFLDVVRKDYGEKVSEQCADALDRAREDVRRRSEGPNSRW